MKSKYPYQLESDFRGERWQVADNAIAVKVHSRDVCSPPCVLHAPTDHHMRDWYLFWRDDRQFFERICQHGVGHPDPDETFYGQPHPEAQRIHGCDGCCRRGQHLRVSEEAIHAQSSD